MAKFTYCENIVCNGVSLFTTVSLPEKAGKFPTVVYRSPYVDSEENLSEEEICAGCSLRKRWRSLQPTR